MKMKDLNTARVVFRGDNEGLGAAAAWVLLRSARLGSALATAVHGCRKALMSCIMAVHRDAGMEG